MAAAGKGERCGREKLQMVLFEYLSKDGAPRIFIFQRKSSTKPQPQSQPKAFKTIQLLSSQNLAQLARETISKAGNQNQTSLSVRYICFSDFQDNQDNHEEHDNQYDHDYHNDNDNHGNHYNQDNQVRQAHL